MIYKLGNKVIGKIEGDILVKSVDSTKHKMNKTSAYGIQEMVFDDLKANHPEVRFIRIYERDTRAAYLSDINLWYDKGQVANYGFGRQRFLELEFMQVRPGRKYTGTWS